MSDFLAIVESGTIVREWTSRRLGFESGGSRYCPGENAGDEWFISAGVYIGTITKPGHDPAVEELTGPLDTVDDEARTVTRVFTVRPLGEQEKDDAADADLESNDILKAAIKAVVQVAGLDAAAVVDAFKVERRRQKEGGGA